MNVYCFLSSIFSAYRYRDGIAKNSTRWIMPKIVAKVLARPYFQNPILPIVGTCCWEFEENLHILQMAYHPELMTRNIMNFAPNRFCFRKCHVSMSICLWECFPFGNRADRETLPTGLRQPSQMSITEKKQRAQLLLGWFWWTNFVSIVRWLAKPRKTTTTIWASCYAAPQTIWIM